MSSSGTPASRPPGRSAPPDDPLLHAYHELWPEPSRIRRAAYRCGGPRRARRAVDYLGFDQLNAGCREVVSMAATMGLTAGSRVLEIGSGVGGPARQIAERFGCRLVGLDVNPRQVRRARMLTAGLDVAPRVTFVLGEAAQLPFATGSFSHAYSFEAFVHVRDKAAALAEIFRVLRPGGTLVIQDPVHRPDLRIAMLTGTLHPWPVQRYLQGLRAAGFTSLDSTDRSAATERAYRLFIELLTGGFLPPWRMLAILDELHPGVRPPLRRFLSAGRLPHALRYLTDRRHGALDLLETPARLEGVRQMCADIVSGLHSGEISMHRIRAVSPAPTTGTGDGHHDARSRNRERTEPDLG